MRQNIDEVSELLEQLRYALLSISAPANDNGPEVVRFPINSQKQRLRNRLVELYRDFADSM